MSYNSKYKSSKIEEILDSVGGKQDKLVSGTNIKTINGTSLLGGGDVTIVGEKGEKGDQGPAGPQGNSAFDGNGVEIVNNLTQGGEAAVLSAEQGKILKTEVTELSGEIDSVESKTSGLLSKIEHVDIEWKEGYRKVSDLQIAETPNNLHSTPIFIESGTYVRFFTADSYQTISMVTEVDSVGNAIKSLAPGSARNYEFVFVADHDMYIEFSIYAKYKETTLIDFISSKTLHKIIDNTNRVHNDVRSIQKYINNTATIKQDLTSNSQWITFELAIEAGVEYKLSVLNGRIANQWIYNDSGEAIEKYDINIVSPSSHNFIFKNSGKLSVHVMNISGVIEATIEDVSSLTCALSSIYNGLDSLNKISLDSKNFLGMWEEVSKEFTLISGYRNYFTKEISNSGLYSHTSPIAMKKNEVLVSYCSSVSDNILCASKVDSNGNWIEDISVNSEKIYYIATEDCYVEVVVLNKDNVVPSFFISELISNSVGENNVTRQTYISEKAYQSLLNGKIELKDYAIRYRTALSGNGVVNDNYSASTEHILSRDINMLRFFVKDKADGELYSFKFVCYDDNENYILDYTINEEQQINIPFSHSVRIQISKKINGNAVLVTTSDIQKIYAELLTSASEYMYYGKRMTIYPRLRWKNIALASYGDRLQDGCCYGDILFQFYGQDTTEQNFIGVEVFDLSIGKLIQQIPLPFDELQHNNAVTFGKKYDESDYFPLIYASGLFSKKIDVYRVGGDYGNYTLTKIQTIFTDSQIPYPTALADNEGNLFVETAIGDGLTGKIYKFILPKSYEDVTLNTEDAVDAFEIPLPISDGEQGGCVEYGKMYFSIGFSENRNFLYCIDLIEKKIISKIRFTEIGLNYEPEGAFVYNGKLCVPFNSSRYIVQFDFL